MRRSFVSLLFMFVSSMPAVSVFAAPIIRGVGDANLIGNDLTDLGNNGSEGGYVDGPSVPPAVLSGFDARFFASAEPGFGGGENAFNVFDNLTGGSNNKWCCNPVSEAVDGSGHFVGADFSQTLAAGTDVGIVLNRFTVTSGNDSPGRDADVWSIQGSNDGTTWTTIYSDATNGTTVWTARDQVVEFSVANGDFTTPIAFDQFRMFIDSVNGAGEGIQFGELEFFGNIVVAPEPASVAIWSLIGVAGLMFGWRQCRRRR